MFSFNDNLFFYVCLPPIVFASGFNMKRKKFFENIGYIMLFGLVGTFICFTMFSLFTWAFMESGTIEMYNGATGEIVTFTLSVNEILLMCSLLCSSDVIAAIAVVKYEDSPNLFSVVFGEGITNDAVSIILFNTVETVSAAGAFTASTPFSIISNFFSLGFQSILIGVVFGLLSSFIFKHCRFMTVSAVVETSLVFCFAYISYALSELLADSGIITLLTCGIIMAHYTWFNLSPQGK